MRNVGAAKPVRQWARYGRRLGTTALAFFGLWSIPPSAACAAPAIPGDLLVADSRDGDGYGVIIEIDPHTGSQTIWASGGYINQPTNMAFDGQGNVIVSDYESGNNGQVIRISLATGQQTLVTTGNNMVGTSSVNVEPAGTYLAVNDDPIVSPASPNIVRINPTTGAQTVVVYAASFSGSPLSDPRQSVLEADGNLLVANLYAGEGTTGILKVNSQTGATSVLSSGGNFNSVGPVGLFLSPANPGDLLVTCPDFVNPSLSTLLDVNTSTGAQSVVWSGGLLKEPLGITEEDATDILVSNYANYNNPTASIIDINPLADTETLISSGGELQTPQAILVVPEPAGPIGTFFLSCVMLLGRKRSRT